MEKLKKLVSLILAAVVSCSMGCTSAASSLSIGISSDFWFNKKVEDVGTSLEQLGYEPSPENESGILKDVMWKYTSQSLTPYTISVMFRTADHITSRVSCDFLNDAGMFQQLYGVLTTMYGEPSYSEFSRVQEGNKITITPEAYNWRSGTAFYSLVCTQTEGERTIKIDEALNGEAPFKLNFSPNNEKNDTDSKDSSVKATPTPRPTAVPKPVNLEVSINSVQIKQTNSGTRQFYIRFKNDSAETVDRIDFKIQGFNRYGEKLTYYNTDTIDFYYDKELKPGQLTRSDWRYTSYMLNEATTIKVAISKYHQKNGKTVEVPDFQLVWHSFE